MESMLGLTAAFIGLVSLYFLPTIVAFTRRHKNKMPIALVNLFVGWTVLGWFVALVWSFTSHTNAAVASQQGVQN